MRVTLLILFLPLNCICQQILNNGIQFQSDLSWNLIKAKAKEEHKEIFVDCYTTWCGPCKYMSNTIFKDKNVGDYFNSHFINLSVQMDVTANDNQATRDWYSDAATMAKSYNISVYPTYLFFSAEGDIIHRFSGATAKGEEFISKAMDAFDTSKQYYTLMNQWRAHKFDSAYLLRALTFACNESDNKNAADIGEAYEECIKERFTKENIKIILSCGLVQNSSDKWFRFLVDNSSKINEIMENERGKKMFVEWSIGQLIFKDEVISLDFKEDSKLDWKIIVSDIRNKYPTIAYQLTPLIENYFRNYIGLEINRLANKDGQVNADWSKIWDKLQMKYPEYDFEKVYLKKKADYFAAKMLWGECSNATYNLLRKYGGQIGSRDLDNLAWDYIFMHCNNKMILEETLKWMKLSIEKEPGEEHNLDTYANLLYKIGNKKDAISWEKRAIDAGIKNNADVEDLNDFKACLQKMQAGVSTWDTKTPS
jgi:thiol-disulfide isomerase/thioredoxin